jgi:ribonuclease D
VPALSGWRRTLFGEDALALKHGALALTAKGKRIAIIPVKPGARAAAD